MSITSFVVLMLVLAILLGWNAWTGLKSARKVKAHRLTWLIIVLTIIAEFLIVMSGILRGTGVRNQAGASMVPMANEYAILGLAVAFTFFYIVTKAKNLADGI